MDLLQEKKNFENNQPLALNKNPSQPPSPTKLKTQGSSKFSFDNLKIQTDTPKSNKNALTKKISGVISDKSAFIKQKIESVQQIPIPIITLKNEEKIFKEIKQPAGDLSPKMKVLPEISPKSKSKKNISQTTIHSKSPKTKSKNKTIKPIQVKSQEKINHNNQNDVQPNIPIKSFLEFSNPIMESKECNTEFVEFLSFLNFGEKLSDILENIDFSNENVRNHFEKIFEQYIKNSRNKINDNSEKVISKNDVGLQTEIDILFIPTIENVSTQNIDGITIETLYTNKKPEFYQFQLESDEIFNTRKSLNNLDFSHQENQNIIPNNKKNNSEIYENSLSFHEKFNKISQKLSNDQIQQKNPQIPFPILENSEILSYSKSKAYLPQKSKAENIHKNTNRTHNFDKKMEERRSNKIYEKLESKSMEDLPMGYSSNRKLTEFRELRKNEAIEEEDEQYINAKEVFEHLYKNSEVNFSKIKYMFNYPFKKIEDFSARKKTENLEEKFLTNKDNLNFETFKALFDRLIQAHIKCGKNCKHLKRFYKNIGFGMGSNKKEFYISKKIISRLPKI